jgi:DNA-binding transcriptional LysR family regulator
VRFDLTTLSLLVAAIDQGSIAKAAEREHIVASAASKRIADLETGLGVALLVRQHGGVVGTAAGDALARQAREVIKTLERIPGAISTVTADDRPDIRILGNQTAVVVVAEELASYIARQPSVRIRLEEAQSLPIIESVAQGNADVGIIGHFQPTDRLNVVPYRSVPLMLAVPQSHALASRAAISFAEALDFELITLMHGTAMRGWVLAAAARMGRTPKFRMQVLSYETMRAMVQAGLGIGVIPAPNIVPFLDVLRVRALRLTDEWASMQLHLVSDPRTAANAAVQQLLAHLAAS